MIAAWGLLQQKDNVFSFSEFWAPASIHFAAAQVKPLMGGVYRENPFQVNERGREGGRGGKEEAKRGQMMGNYWGAVCSATCTCSQGFRLNQNTRTRPNLKSKGIHEMILPIFFIWFVCKMKSCWHVDVENLIQKRRSCSSSYCGHTPHPTTCLGAILKASISATGTKFRLKMGRSKSRSCKAIHAARCVVLLWGNPGTH